MQFIGGRNWLVEVPMSPEYPGRRPTSPLQMSDEQKMNIDELEMTLFFLLLTLFKYQFPNRKLVKEKKR